MAKFKNGDSVVSLEGGVVFNNPLMFGITPFKTYIVQSVSDSGNVFHLLNNSGHKNAFYNKEFQLASDYVPHIKPDLKEIVIQKGVISSCKSE
jgi:hypothetical protein